MVFSTENILLCGAVLLFISLFWERMAHKFEVFVLLLFLGLGMLVSSRSIGGIHFSNHDMAHLIGMIALAIILFSGGMDAKFKEVKPIMVPSIILATLGVMLTALVAGVFIYWVTTTYFIKYELTFIESLLLASIVASTDFALVFAILHSKGLRLKHNLGSLLEFESGSNDVMAYLLLMTFLGYVTGSSGGDASFVHAGIAHVFGHGIGLNIVLFFYKLIVGALCGYFLGKLVVKVINRVNMSNGALYPIFLLAICLILFLFTELIEGSGFLAVYIGGLTVGNSRFVHKRSSKNFFDGFSWLAQILMFFTFGMLIDPTKLPLYAGIGITIGLFILIFARPLAVMACIFPFKKTPIKAKIFVSWVGLRGAVPLIFATCILASDMAPEKKDIMFYIVFFIMLVSLLVQGNTVSSVANMLKLGDNSKHPKHSSEAEKCSEDIKPMLEITVQKEHLKEGNFLMDMELSEETLIAMVKRGNHYFVPKGDTKIEEGDILLTISEDDEALCETCKNMGIKC